MTETERLAQAIHDAMEEIIRLRRERETLRAEIIEWRIQDAVRECLNALHLIDLTQCKWCGRRTEKGESCLDCCPNCGGPADNGHDRSFPPSPYFCTKCEGDC